MHVSIANVARIPQTASARLLHLIQRRFWVELGHAYQHSPPTKIDGYHDGDIEFVEQEMRKQATPASHCMIYSTVKSIKASALPSIYGTIPLYPSIVIAYDEGSADALHEIYLDWLFGPGAHQLKHNDPLWDYVADYGTTSEEKPPPPASPSVKILPCAGTFRPSPSTASPASTPPGFDTVELTQANLAALGLAPKKPSLEEKGRPGPVKRKAASVASSIRSSPCLKTNWLNSSVVLSRHG